MRRAVLEQPAPQLVGRLGVLSGAERRALQLGIQLGQLLAVHPAQRVRHPHVPAAGAAQQRRHEQPQRHDQQCQGGEPQRRHGASPRSSASDRARSAGVSGRTGARARRTTARPSVARPAASSAKGPSQSSQVTGTKGGS